MALCACPCVWEAASVKVFRLSAGSLNRLLHCGDLGMMTTAGGSGMMPQQRLVADRRWRLGVHSRSHPSAIVAELLRGLQSNAIFWKKMGPYNFKCRKAVRYAGAMHGCALRESLKGHLVLARLG